MSYSHKEHKDRKGSGRGAASPAEASSLFVPFVIFVANPGWGIIR